MSQLFKMLADKNYWYKKYLAGNEAFLQALKHAPEVALDELELFHGNRESLLKILEKLDQRIQVELSQPIWQGNIPAEAKMKIESHISEKDALIGKIVALDTQILGTMEQLRGEGLEKLKLLSKGKKALANYKSSFNYNDKIDKRI